jgi:hypothetical protein
MKKQNHLLFPRNISWKSKLPIESPSGPSLAPSGGGFFGRVESQNHTRVFVELPNSHARYHELVNHVKVGKLV